MSELVQAWQFAGSLASTWQGCLALSAVLSLLALSLWALAGAAHGIACAWRTRRRNGRTAPGPPPGLLVSYQPRLRRDGEPLSTGEAEAFALIVQAWKQEARARQLGEIDRSRTASRRRGAIRRATARVRTGRR